MSIIVADWPDLGLILALLLGNSTIAYWEETQAGNAIAALKAQLTPKATVKRDGAWKVIDAADLVPGGILRLFCVFTFVSLFLLCFCLNAIVV